MEKERQKEEERCHNTDKLYQAQSTLLYGCLQFNLQLILILVRQHKPRKDNNAGKHGSGKRGRQITRWIDSIKEAKAFSVQELSRAINDTIWRSQLNQVIT